MLNTTRMALLVAGLVVCASSPLRGQVLVVAEQDLRFGSVTPGVPAAVAPTDPARRAWFEISGRGEYQLTFVLPSTMLSPTGAQLPVSFGGADGRIEIRHKVTTFDPRSGVEIRINPAEQSASVYLGGRLQPVSGQAAGSYSATITMIVVQTGT